MDKQKTTPKAAELIGYKTALLWYFCNKKNNYTQYKPVRLCQKN
jgi:hypothetical protein